MALDTRPFLVVYVAWYPDLADGDALPKSLFDHYRRDVYKNITGGIGLSVQYRSVPAIASTVPPPVDLDKSETAAVVILIDEHWTRDPAYVEWDKAVRANVAAAGLRAHVYPVAIDRSALALGKQQVAKWYDWEEDREQCLINDLTYQFCRMLRAYLASLQNPSASDCDLEQYLKPVEVFLSHTKHDSDGKRIANIIRDRLHQGKGYRSFFDVHDMELTRFCGRLGAWLSSVCLIFHFVLHGRLIVEG